MTQIFVEYRDWTGMQVLDREVVHFDTCPDKDTGVSIGDDDFYVLEVRKPRDGRRDKYSKFNRIVVCQPQLHIQ